MSNLGPADLDISCLDIERIHTDGQETYQVPRDVVLAPGEVLTIHFGAGLDDPYNRYYNVAGAANLAPSASAAYVLSLSGVTLDVVVLGNYFQLGQSTLSPVTASDWEGITDNTSGNLIRHSVWDSNSATDFRSSVVCAGASYRQF